MTIQVREAVAQWTADAWLSEMADKVAAADMPSLTEALALARALYPAAARVEGEAALAHWCDVAAILADLHMDTETLAAAVLGALPGLTVDFSQRVGAILGPGVARLLEGVGRMAQMRGLRSKVEGASRPEERAAQLESLRKMLLAMVQDIRVVLIALADQTRRLRYLAAQGDEDARQAAARDTFDVFAPLANRLGVWQLKWELEDLAFRCSSPEIYRSIARQLDEKRQDRESFIAQVTERLRAELRAANIAAEVNGRPKHIYSIYRKLSRKDLSLAEVFDIRGVRVLVNDVKDCYAVLGLVHSIWTPLAREFDDYIARPKPNNYRSLHSAVVGPDGKILEVQIRTHEMHRQCEYGVASHWRYKEQSPAGGAARNKEAQFDERVGWLRQILEWRDGLANVADLAEHFRNDLFEETVYVLTPQGRVIDLPAGSTPVDFAYHVHSELGHRCRGSKVDGRMVPLTHALANGNTVEIIAASSGSPSRDWLNPELGYIHSSRARAKVRQWFNSQNLETAIAQGRQMLEKALQREGQTALGLERLAAQLGFTRVEEMLAALGRSEVGARTLLTAIQALGTPGTAALAQPPASAVPTAGTPPATRPGDTQKVLVVGVDKLLTGLARCCKPAPPDPIIGFVTRGKGVSVHRRSCSNVARLPAERLIEAQWSADAQSGRFPVDIEVESAGETDVMHGLLEVLGKERVRVLAARSVMRLHMNRYLLSVEVAGLTQLQPLIRQLLDLPGISAVRRR
ncbi:MAG: bifunctional (p)ppGpp synthetase/guanosine-3',5'-bis(diphosphate) 3'-pyrophosphohydrolase [Burkholderiales bacterium]|nr:bifunctional (p)ppGpp synthetase/guanosine-3',5'-bis(diphosphate) 3'-pyrophosphohydrolase [Burkholderiales bacterium]